jgi:hypothetical protein
MVTAVASLENPTGSSTSAHPRGGAPEATSKLEAIRKVMAVHASTFNLKKKKRKKKKAE